MAQIHTQTRPQESAGSVWDEYEPQQAAEIISTLHFPPKSKTYTWMEGSSVLMDGVC